MKKILLGILFLFLTTTTLAMEAPRKDGDVHIKFKCTPNETFVLPDEFSVATHIYVTTQMGKDDYLCFYVDGTCFKSYRMNQLTGENSEECKVIKFEHDLGHIIIIWEDVLGEHTFTTSEIKYNPGLGIGTALSYIFGNQLVFGLSYEREL